jgi:predicted PurR-regulated permease PerM
MALPPGSRDLPRISFGVLLIAALLGGSLYVLLPFLPALLWATMIVVATWPLMLKIESMVGGRRGLATLVCTLLLLLIVFAPLVAAILTVVDHADAFTHITVTELRLPPPPAWVGNVPFVGGRIVEFWDEVARGGAEGLLVRVAPYAGKAGTWLVGQIGTVGGLALHLVFTVTICAILYATGETAAKGVRRFFSRLLGEQGDATVVLAGASIRAVALGIVVTALVQTTLGGLGLLVAGTPYVALFVAAMFVLCIAQLGPMLPMLAAVGWFYYTGQNVTATLLLVWTVLVGSIDNVLRPMLIRRGANLPLLLIMAGVIGGLLAFGIVGLFVGPVVLAVSYTLLGSWVNEQDAAPQAPPAATGGATGRP